MTEKPGQLETHLSIQEIRENDAVQGCYLVKDKRLGTTRNGEPFLSLVLGDRSGDLEARVWEDAAALAPLFQRGDVVEIVAKAASFRGKLQLNVTGLRVPQETVDPALFVESSTHEPAAMLKELKKLLRTLRQPNLKTLIERFLSDQDFMNAFVQAPAAKHFHHDHLGGLLEHTLSVCKMAEQVAKHYPQLDRDLLLTGAFLHDVGKARELAIRPQPDYTDEGRLLGHVVLGALMLEEKLAGRRDVPPDLALRLKHLILSHHGVYEFGSPKRPKFLEAVALNLVDDLDAKLNGLSRFLERDRQEGHWTDFHRLFDRYFLKGELPQTREDEEEPTPAHDPQASLFT